MSGQPVLEKKNYWSLDVAKFFCALTIISAHFAAEWGHFPRIIDYAFSIYVLAVPFFFCCSGFLFFKKSFSLTSAEDIKNNLIKYIKRIFIMYGLWSIVYFPCSVYDWVKVSTFKVEFAKYLHRALVIQTYPTIWFLPALAIGVLGVYFLAKKVSVKSIAVISVVLYIFGMLGHTYNFILEGTPLATFFDWYLFVFKTSRNGVFNAIPFVFMGYVVAKKDIVPSVKGLIKYSAYTLVSLLLMIAESFILKLKFGVTGMDIGIFIVPLTYSFIMAALNLELAERKIWLWCRKLSLGIFVSQRLFLSSLPLVFSDFFEVLYESNSYLGLIIVVSATMAFSVAIIKGGERIKFLRYFL